MAARRGVTGSVLDVHFAAGERIVAAEELHPLLAADHVDLERLGRAARRCAHEEDRRGRLGIEIADLLRLRVRPRGDDAVVHDVPERHQMRAAIGADGGACHDAFLAEEARELGLRHLDLGPSRHDYKLISWPTFSRWCVASPNVNSDDLARLK